MNSAAVTLVIVGIIVVIAVIAWLLYRSGFKLTQVTAKIGGLLEAKMERKPGETAPPVGASRIEVSQKTSEEGVIHKSGITAPAQSDAKIEQQSTKKGRIDDSPIKLS